MQWAFKFLFHWNCRASSCYRGYSWSLIISYQSSFPTWFMHMFAKAERVIGAQCCPAQIEHPFLTLLSIWFEFSRSDSP